MATSADPVNERIEIGSANDAQAVVAGTDNKVRIGDHYKGNQIGQINIGLPEGVLRSIRRPLSPWALTADTIDWLQPRFIKPPKYDQAGEKLDGPGGTVLLSGPPGVGRRSAAIMLLHEFGADSTNRYLEIPVEEETDEGLWLDPELIQPEDKLLLDLSEQTNPEKVESLNSQLENFRAGVAKQKATLVVVLSAEAVHHLRPELRSRHVAIGRPDPQQVLRKHLEESGLQVTDADLQLEELKKTLAEASMGEIGRLSERLLEAKEQQSGKSFQDWAKSACTALGVHSSAVATKLENRSAEKRALLLAAAMLDGSHADAVFEAADHLLDQLGRPEQEDHVLELEGLDPQLQDMGVEVDSRRRIRFSQLGFAEAVRTYFWTNYPALREAFRDWVDTCLGSLRIADKDQDELLDRFAELACRTHRAEDLCELAERWTAEASNQYQQAKRIAEGLAQTQTKNQSRAVKYAQWAARALEAGLQAGGPQAGAVRRRIYEWATQPDLPVTLAQVLIQVCSAVMAVTHPDRAAVRLRHLCYHWNADIRRFAHRALVALAANNRFLRRLLRWLQIWFDRARQAKKADVQLFLAVANPHQLVDDRNHSAAVVRDNNVRAQLVTGWRAVFSQPEQEWRSRFHDWLAACQHSEHAPLLVEVLVRATGGELKKLAVLHVHTRNWAASTTDPDARTARQRVFRQISEEMDRMQGLTWSTNHGTD